MMLVMRCVSLLWGGSFTIGVITDGAMIMVLCVVEIELGPHCALKLVLVSV